MHWLGLSWDSQLQQVIVLHLSLHVLHPVAACAEPCHCVMCFCRCHSLLQSLPDTLGGLTALTHLSIETASLTALPESIGNLVSLRELVLNYCHCLQVRPMRSFTQSEPWQGVKQLGVSAVWGSGLHACGLH
jgi:hypothetical protein